jgi:hypothetical protein
MSVLSKCLPPFQRNVAYGDKPVNARFSLWVLAKNLATKYQLLHCVEREELRSTQLERKVPSLIEVTPTGI